MAIEENTQFSIEEQRIQIVKRIEDNLMEIESKSKENLRLFKRLKYLNTFPLISQEKKERYDKELSTDNWKNFSKGYYNNNGTFEKVNQNS